MDLRKYFSKDSSKHLVTGSNTEKETNPSTSLACATQLSEDAVVDETDESLQPQRKKPRLTPCEKKKVYKSQLSYKPKWEKSTHGSFALIPKKACSVALARSGKLHLQVGNLYFYNCY